MTNNAAFDTGFENPFSRDSVPNQPFLARLLRKPDTKGGFLALKNLLAAQQLSAIDASLISAIVSAYRLTPDDVRSIGERLWDLALRRFVKDGELNEKEVLYLAELKRVLQVSDAHVKSVRPKVIHPHFESAVVQALADGTLTEQEKETLSALLDKLGIDREEYVSIYGPLAGKVIQERLDRIVEDQQATPEEMIELANLAKELNIDLEIGEPTQVLLRRYANYWTWENGALPVVDAAGIVLQKGEVCHYAESGSTWYEPRTKSITTDLGSIGYSFRLARGLYYRSPRIRATRVKTDVLTAIETGSVYITNKRVIFDGANRNMAVRLPSLIGYEVWADAVKLEKATGRSPVVSFSDAETAAVILGVALAKS